MILTINMLINLIESPERYYQNELFRGRVHIDKSLLQRKITNEVLEEKIVGAIEDRNRLLREEENVDYSMVLVEFIRKKSAKDFYEYLVKKINTEGYRVLELTGDDSVYERERILEIIRNNKNENIILVTTQIIEAGVDIDMDIGFKDTALLDNDEQFLGRINRSCLKKGCVAYFFDMDNEKGIYQDDLRLGKNLSDENYFNYLVTKNFKPYYKENFAKISLKNGELSRRGIEAFYKKIRTMKVQEVAQHMQLIEDNTIQIFIPHALEKEEKQADGSVKVRVIEGEKVWEDYVALLEDTTLRYAEKAIKLLNMKEQINLFTYQVYGSGIAGIEPIGDIFYIENGERFVQVNKFRRAEFESYHTIVK